jgi:hypothetical protein
MVTKRTRCSADLLYKVRGFPARCRKAADPVRRRVCATPPTACYGDLRFSARRQSPRRSPSSREPSAQAPITIAVVITGPFLNSAPKERHNLAHGRKPWVKEPSLSSLPLSRFRERGAEGGVRASLPGLAAWAALFRPFRASEQPHPSPKAACMRQPGSNGTEVSLVANPCHHLYR